MRERLSRARLTSLFNGRLGASRLAAADSPFRYADN
jgi:hypothetical protein